MITASPDITEAGKNLFMRSIIGETITFSRFKIGNGNMPSNSDCASLTDLVNPIVSFSITNIDKSKKGYVTITGSFDSSYIKSDFLWRELGIFCYGEDGEEILYAYCNDGNNSGLLKANASDVVAEYTVSLVIAVGEATHVTAILSESVLYAPKKDFDAHCSNNENPHKVTAKQIGLGNVPNVTTNDQTPTYDTPKEISELTSGEKLSAAFGKIRRAITDLISHLKNENNPHKVTAAQIKAAKENHEHSTNDMTSGILGVARGGTGRSKLSEFASDLSGYVSNAMIVTGTYTGTGKYGDTNPNILTFAKAPKLLIVQPSVNNGVKYGGFIAIRGVYNIYNGGIFDDVNVSHLRFSWIFETVSWFGSNATEQLNIDGQDYIYFAIL